jgi:hypothetical protein
MIAAHGPRQCDKCSIIFAKSKEQLKHRKSDSCRQQQQNLQGCMIEDINNELWVQIECLFKTKGRSRMLPESQTQHSIDKWYEMWRFLFGDLQGPAHPCEYIASKNVLLLLRNSQIMKTLGFVPHHHPIRIIAKWLYQEMISNTSN